MARSSTLRHPKWFLFGFAVALLLAPYVVRYPSDAILGKDVLVESAASVANISSVASVAGGDHAEIEPKAFQSSASSPSLAVWPGNGVRFFAGKGCSSWQDIPEGANPLNAGQSCEEVCQARGLVCDVRVLGEVDSEERVVAAARDAGLECRTPLSLEVNGAWDGPWFAGGECAFTRSRSSTPLCAGPRPSCGVVRLCACREEAVREPVPATTEEAVVREDTTTSVLPTVTEPVAQTVATTTSTTVAAPQGGVPPLQWIIQPKCSSKPVGLREDDCNDVCRNVRLGCNVNELKKLRDQGALTAAVAAAGRRCTTMQRAEVAGPWDGPLINNGICFYNVAREWSVDCAGPLPACGYTRVCPCGGAAEFATPAPVTTTTASTTTTPPPATSFAMPAGWPGVHFAVSSACLEGHQGKEQSCDEVCGAQGMTCDVGVLGQIDTKERVAYAAQYAGLVCRRFQLVAAQETWDGPWYSDGLCAYTDSRVFKPKCSGPRTECGYPKLCPCRETSNTSKVADQYRSGGPVWPAESASSYPWAQAAGRVVDPPQRLTGLQEKIWARANSVPQPPCGKPCVAHCIVGQPRELVESMGLAKVMRHRLIDRLSPNSVTFAVFVVSGMIASGLGQENSAGYIRSGVSPASAADLIPKMEYMGVERALFLSEPCVTGGCLQKSAGIVCDAKELKLMAHYDKQDGKVHTICDVQVRRFQTCMHLVREYEQEHQMQFDWVSRLRPDVWWSKPASNGPSPGISELRSDRMYLAHWNNCGYGGGDWYYIAPRHIADIVVRMPDEMTCKRLHHPKVLPNPCEHCFGCECMLAGWLYSENIDFEILPWEVGLSPVKFCNCPKDWEVTPESIEAR